MKSRSPREKVNEALERLEKKGEIEWVGHRFGEKTYRLTEKGIKHAKAMLKEAEGRS